MAKKIEVFASEAQQGELENFPDIKRGWGVTKSKTGGIPPMKWYNAMQKRTDEAINQVAKESINGYTFKDGGVAESQNDWFEHEGKFYYRKSGFPHTVKAGTTPDDDGGIWSCDDENGEWVLVGGEAKKSELMSVTEIPSLKSLHGIVLCKGFYKGSSAGGGIFLYDDGIPRKYHNGITIISPEVKFTNITEWLNIDDGREGKGCWVKQIQGNTITSDECGCIPDGDNPVDIPYFESLRDIEMMKGYQVGKDVGTDNQPMLQAMLNLGVTNIIITKGNYRIKNPLEYMENTIIHAHGAHIFASKDFGKTLPKESRILLKSKRSKKVFVNHARVNGGRWDGCYRYYNYHENALSRSIAAGFTKDKEDPVTNRMWSVFECYNMTDFELHNVNSAFGRYLNDDVYSINSYYFKCKSYYMEDDCYTSSSGGDITIDGRKTYGQQITYDNCEAWFAGFGSGAGSSGFEIDDGPDKTLYINCKTFFCPRGFNQHVHPYAEHTDTPSRNNYSWVNCSVYSSYIDLDYSPISTIQTHGAFVVAGGDLNGVGGLSFIDCYVEDNIFNDFYINQAQAATKKPIEGVKIIGFQSRFTGEFSDLASAYLKTSEDSCALKVNLVPDSPAAGLMIGFSISNSIFDGGGYKQVMYIRGGSDINIDSTCTFSGFTTIGRLISSTVIPEYNRKSKLLCNILNFKNNLNLGINPNILRVEGGDIFDSSGLSIDLTGAATNAHTLITSSASINRVSDCDIKGNDKIKFILVSGRSVILKGGTFNKVPGVISGTPSKMIGSELDNLLVESVWN